MTTLRWFLPACLAVTFHVACGPERRGAPTPDEEVAGEGEGEVPAGDQGADDADGEQAPGDAGAGEQDGGEGEGEAGAGEGGRGEGEEEGEGEGEPPDLFCRDNFGCPDGAYCDRGAGQCIVADGCDPCDPTDFCAADDGQPQRCDFRFGAAGCCVGSCISDDDCAQERYCNFAGPSCDEGCRVGGCDPGLICPLIDRVCRQGCLEHGGCEGQGRICDLDDQVCVDGCVAEDGCQEGERCDLQLRQCTTGCVADADCGQGRRCHRAQHRCVDACERHGDCLEGQLCDGQVTGCVALGAGCVAAGCAEGGVCDPMRGICGALAEVACDPGGECAQATTCVPEGAQDRFACAPAAGAGGAGDPCEAGAQCVSGICLNDGSCYQGCGDDAHCPDLMRCWSARFLVGLAEDLLDPAGDAVREVPACRTPPTLCLSPEGCPDAEQQCLPWWDPDADAMSAACRPAAGGQLAPGQRCHTDDDCSTGLCTADSICLEICDGDDSCEAGQLCGSVPAQAEGRQGQVPACGLDPGSGQACGRDADCPEGEGCHPEAAEAEDAVDLRCRPGAGLGPAALCDEDWDCLSGHCVNSTYCFGGCAEEADCPPGVPCQEQPSGVRGRRDVLLTMCIEPNLPCVRDADCPLAGQACSPEEDPDAPEELAPLCREAVGQRRGGDDCQRDRECLSGYCIQELPQQVCWEGCTGDEDCDDDMRCYDDVAPVPVDDGDAYASLPACLPERGSLDDCGDNDDCGAGEVCSVVVSGDRQALNTRCISQLADPALDEGICASPDRCSTGLCGPQSNPIFPGPCLVLCDADDDCDPAWGFGFLPVTCTELEVELLGAQGTIHYCSL